MDRLLVLGRGVAVGEQREVGADARPEAVELKNEVEPPARVALPEDDHQRRGGEQPTGDAATAACRTLDHLARLVDDRGRGRGSTHQRQHDGYGDDEENAEERGDPVQPVGVVDLEASRISLLWRNHDVPFCLPHAYSLIRLRARAPPSVAWVRSHWRHQGEFTEIRITGQPRDTLPAWQLRRP